MGNKLFEGDLKFLENMSNQLTPVTPHSIFYNIHILVGVRLALPLPTRPFFISGTTFLFNSFALFVCSLQNPMRLCYIDSSFHESRYMVNIIS